MDRTINPKGMVTVIGIHLNSIEVPLFLRLRLAVGVTESPWVMFVFLLHSQPGFLLLS